MTKDELKILTSNPGIYKITNIINNKCYIGQAINLKKRLFAHYNSYNKEQYQHLVIYKAINKYGIENFKLEILEELELNDETKKQLDILEIKYIEQFDSYNKGYNSTLGDDGGILEYKMTPEQIEKIKQTSLKHNNKETIIVNLNTKEEFTFQSITEAAQFIGTSRDVLGKRVRGEVISPINNFLPKDCMELYLEKLNSNTISNGQFESLYTKEEFLNLLEQFKDELTTSNIEKLLKMSKKSFYNYLYKYDISSPLNTHKVISYYVLENINTKDLTKHSLTTLANFFNVKEASMRKQCQRCKEEDKLYKKIYKIYTVYSDYISELHHYVNKKNNHTLTSIYDKLHLFNSFDDISDWEQID